MNGRAWRSSSSRSRPNSRRCRSSWLRREALLLARQTEPESNAAFDRVIRAFAAIIESVPEAVFAFIDDHSRFASHMSESSWMMAGSRMSVEVDAGEGRAVGSHIRLSGRVLGARLFLDEVVTRRNPPTEKVWQTVGPLRLLIIGPYTMGVAIARDVAGSRLRVFIDYELPTGRATRWLGRLLGGSYARWCVNQMMDGVGDHFRAHRGATGVPAAGTPAARGA